MRFSRQEHRSGFPFPSPGDLPDPGMEPGLLHCRWILHHLSHPGSPPAFWHFINSAFLLFTYSTAALWIRPGGGSGEPRSVRQERCLLVGACFDGKDGQWHPPHPHPFLPQPVLDSLAVLVSRALMEKGQDQSSIHSRDLAWARKPGKVSLSKWPYSWELRDEKY